MDGGKELGLTIWKPRLNCSPPGTKTASLSSLSFLIEGILQFSSFTSFFYGMNRLATHSLLYCFIITAWNSILGTDREYSRQQYQVGWRPETLCYSLKLFSKNIDYFLLAPGNLYDNKWTPLASVQNGPLPPMIPPYGPAGKGNSKVQTFGGIITRHIFEEFRKV